MSKRLVRAQSNLVAVVLLISAVAITGIGLTTYTMSNLNNMKSLVELKESLRFEAFNTVVYEEFRNDTHVCLGLIRLVPEYRTYYYFVTVEGDPRHKSIAFAEYGYTAVSPNRVYILDSDYTPMSAFLIGNIPLGRLIYNPTVQQPLVCLTRPRDMQRGQTMAVYIAVELGGNYYEVARWYT